MADDPQGFLDGKPVRLSEVPLDRRPDFEVERDGKRERPFRFLSESHDEPFKILR